MKENKLGETFVSGRMVNLDTANIEDLERYISELEKEKETAMVTLNGIINEIRNK